MSDVKELKLLNRSHTAWHEVLVSNWPIGRPSTLNVSFYKLIILKYFLAISKPNKHIVNLKWTKEREAYLINNFNCAYLYNKFVVGEELKYRCYNLTREPLTKFLSNMKFSFTDSSIKLVIETPKNKKLFNSDIGKSPVDEFTIKEVTVNINGDVFVNGDIRCVRSLSKKAGTGKNKMKEKENTMPSASYSGRMVDAKPVWKEGYPSTDGVYICATFPREGKEVNRDVLVRLGVSDSHTEIKNQPESTRVEENLYVFFGDHLKQKKCPWQHAKTGFWDNGVTHYLDFEVSYDE